MIDMKDNKPTLRADSYANAITGLATPADKSLGGFHYRRHDLGVEQLNSIYEQDAIAARIVDRVVDDSIREGFRVAGPDAAAFDFGSIDSEIEDLDALNIVADGWRWSRLYGGALLILVVNDGQTMDQPLNLETATRLSSIQVVEAPYVLPAGYNPGLGARAFRNPEHYDITVPFGSAKLRRVHRSRTIRIDGLKVSPTRMIAKNGWGPSVIDRVYTEISQLGEVMGYCRSIMHDISIQVYKLDGFRDQLCGSAQSQAEMRQILETIRFSVDNLHVLALDSADEYSEVSRNVSGLKELTDKFVDALVRATDMPRTILLGEQPGGLNASSDSEIRAWFDHVASQQKQILAPVISRVMEILLAVRSNRGEDVPEEWTIEFPPLWQPTADERSQTYLRQAQADQIYFLNGVLSADEIRARLVSEGMIEAIEMPDTDGGEGGT